MLTLLLSLRTNLVLALEFHRISSIIQLGHNSQIPIFTWTGWWSGEESLCVLLNYNESMFTCWDGDRLTQTTTCLSPSDLWCPEETGNNRFLGSLAPCQFRFENLTSTFPSQWSSLNKQETIGAQELNIVWANTEYLWPQKPSKWSVRWFKHTMIDRRNYYWY